MGIKNKKADFSSKSAFFYPLNLDCKIALYTFVFTSKNPLYSLR